MAYMEVESLYKEYPFFYLNERKKIWKYMDLSKFLYLLVNQKIYMNRIDKFEDCFEGTISKGTIDIRQAVDPEDIDSLQRSVDFMRRTTYISCFHINDFESAAMWSLYSKNSGIAIQTTVQQLIDAMREEEKNIYIGEVGYYDYRKDYIFRINDLFSFVISKRKSFEHERELRCVFSYYNYRDVYTNSKKYPSGVDINVDLSFLIEKVYISPYAEPFLKDILEKVIKQYNYNFEIVQSSLCNML